MTLETLKKNVLKMIEEISETPEVYTDDPDIDKKMNTVINQVMFEVARMKKIPAKTSIEIDEPGTFDLNGVENFYQLDHIRYKDAQDNELEPEIFQNMVECPEVGTLDVYYFRYPERITDDTDDTQYEFELSDDALEVLPYGVAADLLKSDVSASYGQVYAQRYETMLQRLDPRYTMSMIYINSNGVI